MSDHDNIVFSLLESFAKEEQFNIACLVSVTIAFSILQTNGVSLVTSKLINSIQNHDSTSIWLFYKILIVILVIYLIFYYIFNYFQIKLLTKMRPWARHQLLELVMLVNSDLFSEINFTRLNSPINRIADLIASILNDSITFILPNFMYIMITVGYFLYLDPMFGVIFFSGNAVLFSYYFSIFNGLLQENEKHENLLHKTDAKLIDVLSNLDKIIYRGVVNTESAKFKELTDDNYNSGFQYYSKSRTHITVMLCLVLMIIFICLAYMIYLFSEKRLSVISFLSAFSILMLFREKLSTLTEQLPDFIGYIGRMNAALFYFEHVSKHFKNVIQKGRFKGERKLDFHTITFQNVTYNYSHGKIVFENRNYTMDTTGHKIIGITGPSGSGKSTFIKLLIKMYQPNHGTILIDGQDIQKFDPLYIRSEITYVNQTSKLFDKKVIDNMLYGCNDETKCKYFLEKIMQYPNIAKLYQNMDIHTKEAGLLGENLSGGQRQIINMIGGLVNPSKILVLDEPTNALDPHLKQEVIGIIEDFKRYKQAIIIITHDRDLFPLFDDELKM